MFQLSLHLQGISERGNYRSLNLQNNILSSIKRFQILLPLFFKDGTNLDWMIDVEKKLNSLIEIMIQNSQNNNNNSNNGNNNNGNINFELKLIHFKEYQISSFPNLINQRNINLPLGLYHLFELNSLIFQQQWNYILANILSHQIFSFRFELNSLIMLDFSNQWNLNLLSSLPQNSYLLPYEKYINSENSTTNISETYSNITSLLPILKNLLLFNQQQFQQQSSVVPQRVKFLSFSIGK